MNVQSNKITLMQYIFLIHGVQVGLYVLTLPRNLALNAGTDGWITLIICWILSIASSLIVVQIMKKYPNGTIIDLFSHFFGKWAGKLGAVIFSLYFGFLSAVYLIGETLFIQEWILPFTSIPIILFLLAIPTYLLVRTNMTILGRYSQFIFLFGIWILIFLFIPLKYANWLHFLPIVKEGWKPIFAAVEEGLFPFIGFEIAFFLYPFLQNKEKAAVGIVIANSISFVIFFTITIVTYAFFSPDEITAYLEPTLIMLKIIEFHFIERIDIVFFSFYIFVLSTTVLPLMFLTLYCTSELVKKMDYKKQLIVFLILIWLTVVIFPPTFEMNHYAERITQYLGGVMAFVFPVILWGFVSLFRLFKGRATK